MLLLADVVFAADCRIGAASLRAASLKMGAAKTWDKLGTLCIDKRATGAYDHRIGNARQ
jgi:hypothetical protein